MIDFSSLPLSPEQARAARNYCGMTQAQAAKASSLPAYKIKRFELGTTIPDTQFLDDLRAFYESKGYSFPDTEKPGQNAKKKGTVFPAGVVKPGSVDGQDDDEVQVPANRKVIKSTVQHIRISPDLSDDEIGNILDHIEENEEEVEKLLQEKVESGMWGGLSEKSEANHGKMVRLLAENGTLWAMLVGREMVEAPDDKIVQGVESPKTHADLLAKTQADMHEAVSGDKSVSAKRKTAKAPTTLLASIFG